MIDAPAGVEVRIARVQAPTAGSIAAEGLVPGALVAVERHVALGGPVIVRLGRARLALARSIAREVVVEPVAQPAAVPVLEAAE